MQRLTGDWVVFNRAVVCCWKNRWGMVWKVECEAGEVVGKVKGWGEETQRVADVCRWGAILGFQRRAEVEGNTQKTKHKRKISQGNAPKNNPWGFHPPTSFSLYTMVLQMYKTKAAYQLLSVNIFKLSQLSACCSWSRWVKKGRGRWRGRHQFPFSPCSEEMDGCANPIVAGFW